MPHFDAIKELLRRYWQVITTAWQVRKQLTPPDRTAHERAFLPAALELQESPPHPAARVTLWALISFLLIALLWACFGKIDIVATAAGKLVVSSNSKVIQPLEPGIVKAIHVEDGQKVKAGQLLIELDGTLVGADKDKYQSAWLDAKFEALRAQALLTALDTGRTPQLPAMEKNDAARQGISELKLAYQLQWNPGSTPHRTPGESSSAAKPATSNTEDAERNNAMATLASNPAYKQKHADSTRLILSQWQELQARLSTIDTDTARKQAERAGTQEQVSKLEQTLPLIAQRAKDYKDLLDKNFIAKHGYLEKEQTRIETERDLATQKRKIEELTQSIKANQNQRESVQAEFRRIQHDTLGKANERVQELTQEVVKTARRQSQTQLLAPVDGTIQQLVVHTVGGVVTEAQPLMVIVPNEDSIEAEAMLENKDIGFVNVGQEASIKIETFNYTKFGLIPGTVENVSLDAIQDEKRGLIYATRVKLSRTTMNVEGKQVKLTPGMAVTVEIKTGQRRIIEYFLSPLIQYASEGLRER